MYYLSLAYSLQLFREFYELLYIIYSFAILPLTDKPDPPGTPEDVDSSKDHILIKWEPPKKDGGSPITGYNVERKDPKTGRWTKLNSEPLKV